MSGSSGILMTFAPLALLACGGPDAPPEDTEGSTTASTSTPSTSSTVTGTTTSTTGTTPTSTTGTPPTSTTSMTSTSSTTSTDPCEDPCATPSPVTVTLPLDPITFTRDVARTRDNALKGMMTSYLWDTPANDFPDQLEFLYLPMADLWGPGGDTLSTGLEPHLEAAAARGHHAVIRVYVDYPSLDSGLPPHLSDLVDCEPYDDHGGGCSPDYDDPDLTTAMLDLIAAMGAAYDGDPRLGFVQVGLLGFWGEWHTWPHEDWFPSLETQDAVLTAYTEAFPTTHLQVREPKASSPSMRIGFHDDSFAYSTIGETSWFFIPTLEANGAADRWQEVPIGGELRPELQTWIFEGDFPTSAYAQNPTECIEATHASYLLNYQAFNESGVGYLGDERARAEDAALLLGYQFEVQGATLTAGGLLDGEVDAQLTVEVAQTGVAPFYYPLSLTVDAEALPSPLMSEGDLHTLLPGEVRTVTLDLGRVSADLLSASVTLGLSSPMLQESQVVRFATTTAWVEEGGALTVQWTVTCEGEDGATYLPGEVVQTDTSGCDCVCDVDGQARACGLEGCAQEGT